MLCLSLLALDAPRWLCLARASSPPRAPPHQLTLHSCALRPSVARSAAAVARIGVTVGELGENVASGCDINFRIKWWLEAEYGTGTRMNTGLGRRFANFRDPPPLAIAREVPSPGRVSCTVVVPPAASVRE